MAAEVEDLESLVGRIPACCSTTTPELRCCCGRKDCAYLKHNCVALDDLEKEVRTAAQLGQVCIPYSLHFSGSGDYTTRIDFSQSWSCCDI
jgi:hypothetical protein